jgi:hypothetical protein
MIANSIGKILNLAPKVVQKKRFHLVAIASLKIIKENAIAIRISCGSFSYSNV